MLRCALTRTADGANVGAKYGFRKSPRQRPALEQTDSSKEVRGRNMGAAGFRLPNGRTAAYEWGSGALSLASSLRLGAGTETRMLAALAEARAWWSPAEFARYVAVLHESVHCLQDLTTGVGLWDFALWNAREGAVLVELRNASWGTPFGTPLPAAEVSAYHGWLDDGFVPQSAKARARRKLYLQQRISAETVVGALRDPDVFAIDRLLEAEAVVQVTLGLFRLRKTPAEREVMMDQLALWSAPDMAELYQGVYHDVIDLAARWWDADGRVADRKTVQVALWLTCFLIDLSLAHPSMEYLDANGLNPPDYDPGLKFILLVSALARLTTEQHNACLQALLVRRDVAEAERILLEACAALPRQRANLRRLGETSGRLAWGLGGPQGRTAAAGGPPAACLSGRFSVQVNDQLLRARFTLILVLMGVSPHLVESALYSGARSLRTTRRYRARAIPEAPLPCHGRWGAVRSRTPNSGCATPACVFAGRACPRRRVPGAPPDAPCAIGSKAAISGFSGQCANLVRCESERRVMHWVVTQANEWLARRNRQRLWPGAVLDRHPYRLRCSKTRHSGAGWTSAAGHAGRSSYSSARPAMLKCRPLDLANSACWCRYGWSPWKTSHCSRNWVWILQNPHLIIYSMLDEEQTLVQSVELSEASKEAAYASLKGSPRRRHPRHRRSRGGQPKVSRRRAGRPGPYAHGPKAAALGEEGDAASWRAAQTVRRARLSRHATAPARMPCRLLGG